MRKLTLKNILKLILLFLVNPLMGEDTITRIDTHIHLYDTRREGSSTFLDPLIHEKIYFPHFAETFVDTAGPAGIDYAVVVEASQRREDNFWLMEHVDTSAALVAFVANLDPRDPYYISDLDSLSTYEKFRGIRIRPSTSINIADASVMAAFAHLARKNLVLELGGNGVDPATITAIARRFPNMHIIMNHLAGISLQGGQVSPANYADRLAEFAREPNVFCKISALYTLINQDPAPTSPDAYKPLIDPVIDAFGPDRVIFGSNWTLSDMHGSYSDMISMLDLYLEGRDELGPEQFYYENINRAYGINQEESVYSGTGNGLFRSFWNGAAGGRGWFEDSICGEIVQEVDDYWPEGSPACELNSIFWNARWTGTIEAMYSETYTFYLTVNDYTQMWINGQLVIDAWAGAYTHSTLTAEVDMLAGEQVSIQIDFANLFMDGSGRVIYEQHVPEQRIEIDTTGWEQGLYFVQSISESGVVTDQLMIL